MTEHEVFEAARQCIKRFDDVDRDTGITLALTYVWAQAQLAKIASDMARDITQTNKELSPDDVACLEG